MTEDYEIYSDTVKAEIDAMNDLLKSLLSGSRSGDEVKQQIDQHISNMDRAADRYWQQRNIQPVMRLCCAPNGYDTQTLPCAAGDGSCIDTLCDFWEG